MALLAAACSAVLFAAGQAQAATAPAKLLATCEPVAHFDPLESFIPTSVQSFVADADLEQLVGGTWVVVNPDPEPGDLPGPGTGIWRLNQDSCIPPPVLDFFRRNGLPLPVDYAFGGGSVAGPPEADGAVMPIHQISDEGPAWVSFPGFWGQEQYFHAPGITAPLGMSPKGPAYDHSVWTDPLGTLADWASG